MYIKVWSKTNGYDFWSFENFRLSLNANLIEHNNTGNLINFIIYEVEHPFTKELADEYDLEYEFLTNYEPQIESEPTLTNNETLTSNTSSQEDEEPSFTYWWQKD
jgi:hypothetical protein